MNINQLRYAVEVARTGTITQAAGNLYMSQPSLSRAIKELEDNVGFTIFKRTPKGLVTTTEGKEFLSYAFGVMEKFTEMESLYSTPKHNKTQFNISVPRASYISHAFKKLVEGLDLTKEIEINYKETNALKTMNNMLYENYNIGIIRCLKRHEKQLMQLLKNKELRYQTVWEFEMLVAMSKAHPLADKEGLTTVDFASYIQISHGDPYVPTMNAGELRKTTKSGNSNQNIFIYERGSQFEILNGPPFAYMWVSPIPAPIRNLHGIVQRRLNDSEQIYTDLLIFHKNYKFTAIDDVFIENLFKIREELLLSMSNP